MSNLRQAYFAQKTRQDQIITEAATEWLKSNVILINEKIDRKTVNRLIDSIQKFEDTFGPFKEKLPAIAEHLNMAEKALNLVITGKVSNRKTANLLEQLTYLYASFSNFFTRDLPILLKTRLFRLAKDNPEALLNSIEGFDPQTAQEAIVNALKPSVEEKQLLGKIYRGGTLPKMNAKEIARQMLNLTYTDLEELSKIGKVPMAVADTGGGMGGEMTAGMGMPEGVVIEETGEKFINEDVAEAIIKKTSEKMMLDEQVLLEVKLLLEANLQEIQPKIDALKQLVANTEVLQPLAQPINDLQSKLLQVLNDGDVKSYIAQITSGKGKLGDLFKSPKGKILAQANLAIETMNNVAKAWAQIAPSLEKETVTGADIANVKGILAKNIKGGLVQKLKSLFSGVTPFPKLSPDDILNVLFVPLDEHLKTLEGSTDVMQAQIAG